MTDRQQQPDDGLMGYWDRHPAAYIAFCKHQMQRCMAKNGNIKKAQRRAYAYYQSQIMLFEFRHML